MFWLGQALDSAGYPAVPAQSTDAARELLREHRLAVHILVIDPFLPDAFAFVAELRRSHPSLSMVAAVPLKWRDQPVPVHLEAAISKPERLEIAATIPWIGLVQKLWTAGDRASKAVKSPAD